MGKKKSAKIWINPKIGQIMKASSDKVQKVSIVPKKRKSRNIYTYGSNSGLALTKRVHMTYHEEVGLTCTSGIYQVHEFNLTNLYDPDYSGTGHQPYFRDQWAALYNKYQVISAKVTVQFRQIATNNVPHNCFVILDRDASISNNLDTRMERTRGVGNATLLANSNNVKTITQFYSAKKFHDVKDLKDNEDLKALWGTTTGELLPAYCEVGIQPIDSVSTSAAIIYGRVMIDFYVELSEPVNVAGS